MLQQINFAIIYNIGFRYGAIINFYCFMVNLLVFIRFVPEDGKILQHEDNFNFWRWSRMALGRPGLLLGWSPYLINAVRKKVRRRLDR